MRAVLAVGLVWGVLAGAASRAARAEVASESSEPAVVTEAMLAEQAAAEEPIFRAPVSLEGLVGPRLERATLALSGGWPGVELRLDLGVTEDLALGLALGYEYRLPLSQFEETSLLSFRLPVRLRLWTRQQIELTLHSGAGIIGGLDRALSDLGGSLVLQGASVTPLAVEATLGLVCAWRALPWLSAKIGLLIPVALTVAMVDVPGLDYWLLTVPLAATLGAAFRVTDWMDLFVKLDLGPALAVAPNDWEDNRYRYEAQALFFLKAYAGFSWSPWR